MSAPVTYGFLAEFENPQDLLLAAKAAHAHGFRRMNAYSPMPVEGLSEAIGMTRDSVALVSLLGGITGGLGAFTMQAWANVSDYPINVGGRPLYSWPAFIPITFELTVLGAALAAAIGMLAMNRLPKPYHPLFNSPEFLRASRDRFFLCIQSEDPLFDQLVTWDYLRCLNPPPSKVIEVRND